MGVQTDSCAQALGELRDLEPILDLHFRCRSLKDGPNSNFPEGKESSGRDSSDQGDRPSFLQSRCRIVASLLPLSPVVKALKGTIGSILLPALCYGIKLVSQGNGFFLAARVREVEESIPETQNGVFGIHPTLLSS